MNDSLFIVFGSIGFFFFVLSIAMKQSGRTILQKQRAANSRIEAKLDLLLDHAGLEYDPLHALPEDVVQAMASGDKILAIKRYREQTGCGLRDAKEFIESVQGLVTPKTSQARLPDRTNLEVVNFRIETKLDLLLDNAGLEYDPSTSVAEGIVQAIYSGDKILAIKRYRDQTGCGLREAKEYVEDLQSRLTPKM